MPKKPAPTPVPELTRRLRVLLEEFRDLSITPEQRDDVAYIVSVSLVQTTQWGPLLRSLATLATVQQHTRPAAGVMPQLKSALDTAALIGYTVDDYLHFARPEVTRGA